MKRMIDWRLLAVLIVAAILVVSLAPAYADKRGDDIDVDAKAVASADGGDVRTSVRDSSRAFGLGAGDVDINDCYRSYSVIVWQDSKPNPLCLAQQLMAEGNYHAAAVLRCEPRTIHRPFGGKDACVAALSTPPAARPAMVPERVDDDDEDLHEELRQEQQERYEDLMAKIRNLEDEVTRKPVSTRVVERRSYLTDEQKQALKEVLSE